MAGELARIEQRIFLKAAPERVWRAISTRAEFEAWFETRLDADFTAGATIHMVWEDQRFPVEVVAVEPPTRLVWRWHPGMPDPAVDYAREPMTTVTFDVAPHLDGTMLTVTEAGFDAIAISRRPSVFRDNVNGWLGQANSLEKYLETHG